VGCVFAREVWHNLFRRCNLIAHIPAADAKLIEWWPNERLRVPKPQRKGLTPWFSSRFGCYGRRETPASSNVQRDCPHHVQKNC
jgi:hypothetical protein